jgi:hypothetical protein
MEWLKPPDGGLDAVYGRIRRRHRRRTGLAVVAAVGLAVGLFAGPLQTRLPPESRALLAQYDAQYEAREQRPDLRVIGGAALELSPPKSNSRVYLVSTTADPDSGGKD